MVVAGDVPRFGDGEVLVDDVIFVGVDEFGEFGSLCEVKGVFVPSEAEWFVEGGGDFLECDFGWVGLVDVGEEIDVAFANGGCDAVVG